MKSILVRLPDALDYLTELEILEILNKSLSPPFVSEPSGFTCMSYTDLKNLERKLLSEPVKNSQKLMQVQYTLGRFSR